MWGRAGCWGLLAHGNMGMGFHPTLCHPALVCVGSALVVLVGELWAQGALAGPTRMPVALVQERASMVGSCRHVQLHASPPPLLSMGSQRGVPPCWGTAPWRGTGSTS